MSWTRAPLEELASAIDYGITASANFSEGEAKFLRITDIQDNSVDWAKVPYCDAPPKKLANAMLADGDIVFARTGATTGKSFLLKATPKNAVFASYLIRVRPTAKIDSGYLAHFFNTDDYWGQIRAKAQGAAQEGVNASKLASLEIPLPPLDEQKRIAAILDKADQLRQKRRQAIALLESLTQSIFLEMFGDPIGNPNGFEAVELDGLVDRKRGISYGIVQRGGEFSGGIQVLRIGDILDGEVRIDGLVRTDPQIASKFQRTRLLGGELVISIRGTVGRCAIVPETLTNANVSREIAVIPSLERERNEFHLALLRTESAQRRLRDDVKGVAQSGINLEDLRKLPIIRPPLDMVEKFLHICSKLSSQRSRVKLFDELGEKTFSSLQHRAFSGQL
ncbi:hypothetical protein D0Y60_23905 [Shinella sp. WSJ-2]|uniref:restriction endonuclease subunit S n=1 Tax=Shinella sp. WSJ-2 TaxID=2303749 RepID=UPI000E3BC058|nr:restriction endonuclease subunit S [Shinella sp. WSJ-2]RFZ81525.1 hypothetical protein D0Y60_23905 [Shinella sp. WSJ-2]